MNCERLLKELEGDSLERLKWTVLRRMGVSPVSLQGRLLSGRRALKIALHMALDQRREAFGGENTNRGFDIAKFEEMRKKSCSRERTDL